MKLWAEFLGGWFDGNQHMLRGAFVDLPIVNKITFQEMEAQTDDGLFLQVTTERPATAYKCLWSDGRWMMEENVTVNFWFRARIKTTHQGHNSISMARWGADTLYSIFTSALLMAPLSQKGMTQFRPSPTKMVGNAVPATRLLSLKCRYIYPAEETVTMTEANIESNLPGSVVYIGRDRDVRVTSAGGFEKKGPDGNWYSIDISLLSGPGGEIVPSINITEAVDN